MSKEVRTSVRQTTPAATPQPAYFETLGADDPGRSQRTALAIATALHLLVLAVTVPQLYSEDLVAEASDTKVYMLNPVRFRPPPPPTPKPPPTPRANVSVPDIVPDVAELVTFEAPPPEFQLADLDLPFSVPEAPPAPSEPPLPITPPPDIPLRVGVDIEAPARLHFVQPRYTQHAIRTGLRGQVVLQLTIDKEGLVTDLVVRKKLPLGLTEAAVNAVQQWRLGKPGADRINGYPGFGQLDRQGFDQPQHPVFGRAIGRRIGIALQTSR